MKIIFLLLFLFFLFMLYYNIYYLSFMIMMEFVVFTLLFLMIYFQMNPWLFLVYLVFSVCELVLGLSLLVSMNYEIGHQNLSMLNLIL
ncbi:NADH dehydrogenase subunit 4L (mitochondrion) [Apis florea]|uniref:NADH dehydrogenase subunit 4L n=1 Tax=Apis florea TaxID=7463 RepID=R4IQW1_APIFL|nr:NADH dehydrogenase subunit 4L [Apis florea]AFZ41107.1 NADH dehydrogenase subunit 4L [Apis florea]AGC38388.1 NADH dehydrogenase subunit 4L [Apis florea]BBC54816.1 NADH dehydrogenase subunit 4L [Apis florea]